MRYEMKKKNSSAVRLRSPQALLSGTILKKLSALEELLKKKDDKPLTFKDACAYLGYAPSYLYKLTYRKVIPHYKPTGKMIFFSKAELDEWVYKGNVKLRIENVELKDEGASTSLSTKDPNQMEIELKEEVVVELPRKRKR